MRENRGHPSLDGSGFRLFRSGSSRAARSVRLLFAACQRSELPAKDGALEQVVEDLGDALLAATDDREGCHGLGQLLGQCLVPEGLERSDELRLDSLALVDRRLDLGRELCELESLEGCSVVTLLLLASSSLFELEGCDCRSCLLVRHVQGCSGLVGLCFRGELFALLLGVVGDERQVELELALRVDLLQLEGCTHRLGACNLGLSLQLLGLLDELELAALFGEDESVLDDAALLANQHLLDVSVLHLDAED